MGTFEISRSTGISATADSLHRLIDDFHQWPKWSPWEDLDPDLQRTYSGSDQGVGARYAWKGNKKAGEGSMLITGSTPEQVDIEVAFVKPFRNTNQVTFTLTPTGDATEVEWTMRGERTGLWGLIGRLMPMDRLIGRDFEKGLVRLMTVAESDS
jgi:polyketide cyclase/dehydrase/lipid transport protein